MLGAWTIAQVRGGGVVLGIGARIGDGGLQNLFMMSAWGSEDVMRILGLL